MKLFGESAPDGQDGYVPGAWDEVRQAFMDGHISAEAYDLLREAMGLLPGDLRPGEAPDKESS